MVAAPRFVHHQSGYDVSRSDYLLFYFFGRKTYADLRVPAAPGIRLSRYSVSVSPCESHRSRSTPRDRGYRPTLAGSAWKVALFEDALRQDVGYFAGRWRESGGLRHYIR